MKGSKRMSRKRPLTPLNNIYQYLLKGQFTQKWKFLSFIHPHVMSYLTQNIKAAFSIKLKWIVTAAIRQD